MGENLPPNGAFCINSAVQGKVVGEPSPAGTLNRRGFTVLWKIRGGAPGSEEFTKSKQINNVWRNCRNDLSVSRRLPKQVIRVNYYSERPAVRFCRIAHQVSAMHPKV